MTNSSEVLAPKDKGSIKTCVKADFFTPLEKQSWKSQTHQVEIRRDLESPSIINPVWNETFTFEIQKDDSRGNLAFIRQVLLVSSDMYHLTVQKDCY